MVAEARKRCSLIDETKDNSYARTQRYLIILSQKRRGQYNQVPFRFYPWTILTPALVPMRVAPALIMLSASA